ncbi:hypothetical protein SASPL_105167 [Salvia splendens]|uniref:Uncharacterized protein n=1 Tax=Salvia splendens TaxID=180675 RepID=A0A8X8YIT0_SALSN|nr:hypothetical protein SASPL_105167 [Salvia splendens]
MIMKSTVERQDMQELGRPPDRWNDVLKMTSGLSPNDDGNMIEVVPCHTQGREMVLGNFYLDQVDRTIKRYYATVEATGFSGGIWLLWDDFWHAEILATASQYIQVCIWDERNMNFLVMAVYRHPAPVLRNMLWEQLARNEGEAQRTVLEVCADVCADILGILGSGMMDGRMNIERHSVSSLSSNPSQSRERTFKLLRHGACFLMTRHVHVRLLSDLMGMELLSDLVIYLLTGSQLLGANGQDDGPVVLNMIPGEAEGECFEDALSRVRRCVGGGTAIENAGIEVVSHSIPVNLRCPSLKQRTVYSSTIILVKNVAMKGLAFL